MIRVLPVLGCSGMFQHFAICCRMFQDVSGCLGFFWNGIFEDVSGCFDIYFGMFQDASGCLGIF